MEWNPIFRGTTHESPRHRQRRPRARPGLEAGPIAARQQVFCARATPAPPRRRQCAHRVNEFDDLLRFAKKEDIGLTVVGPEEPLAAGIVDAFQAQGLRIFGPTKAAAQIEASKVFAKKLMRHADVPTAEFRVFDHPDPAEQYIETREYPVVVKADGLAAGKGVIVCKTQCRKRWRPSSGSWSARNSAAPPAGRSSSKNGSKARN